MTDLRANTLTRQAGPIPDLTPPAWTSRATCTPDDAELFFVPSRRESTDQRLARETAARALCIVCRARADCLAYALTLHKPDGIWAGLDPTELRAARRRARKERAMQDQPADEEGAA